MGMYQTHGRTKDEVQSVMGSTRRGKSQFERQDIRQQLLLISGKCWKLGPHYTSDIH